jgi:hypothetical protein
MMWFFNRRIEHKWTEVLEPGLRRIIEERYLEKYEYPTSLH